MLFRKIIIVLIFSALVIVHPLNSFGQTVEYELTGKVLDAKKEPVVYATVSLVRQADQILVKAELSNEYGEFSFPGTAPGIYQLVIQHQDFNIYKSAPIDLNEHKEMEIVLEVQNIELDEVAIVVKKPFIEQHFDKTVLNVDQSISNAGSNAFEVLEKAPGLSIDANENISMRGRTGVLVTINGKEVPMSGADLANMLRSLPASSLEKIELITNPSAKYDAAGDAGIINIKLKKESRTGTNGTINSTVGTGERFKTNQGIQLNHRNRKVNVFGNYSFSYREEFTDLDIYREFREKEEITGGYDQQNRFRYDIISHTARIGADYEVSSNSQVGIAAYGLLSNFQRSNNNRSLVLDHSLQPQSYFLTRGESENDNPSGGINLHFETALDTLGRQISGDVDYVSYESSNIQNYVTTYFDLYDQPIMEPYLLYGNLQGDLQIKAVKLDYVQPLPFINGNFEAGAKSSLVDADNDLKFFDRSRGGNLLDERISNRFLYSENINAAYVSVNSKREKFSFQLGLRMENTIAKGDQHTTGETFTRSYTQLFPSGFVGYVPNDNHEFGLSISRRINRPTYNQLNPFKSFLDPSTYVSGNPYLDPELSYALEFTHTVGQKFIMKYSYSRTEDVILNVLSLDPNQEQIVVQIYMNLAMLDYYGFTLTAPFSLGDWFKSTNNATLYYGLYKGNLANTNLDKGRPAFTLSSNNTFNLSDDWTAEIVGNFRSREIYGFLDVQPFWMLSAGIQKQFWNERGSLKLNVSDIFYSRRILATTVMTGYREDFRQVIDSRVINLGFTYRFGVSDIAPARKRTGGAEEEKSRVGQ